MILDNFGPCAVLWFWAFEKFQNKITCTLGFFYPKIFKEPVVQGRLFHRFFNSLRICGSFQNRFFDWFWRPPIQRFDTLTLSFLENKENRPTMIPIYGIYLLPYPRVKLPHWEKQVIFIYFCKKNHLIIFLEFDYFCFQWSSKSLL